MPPILSNISSINISSTSTIDLTADTENDVAINDSDVKNISQNNAVSEHSSILVPLSNISSVTDVAADLHVKYSCNTVLRGSRYRLSHNNPNEGVSRHLYTVGGAVFIFEKFDSREKRRVIVWKYVFI